MDTLIQNNANILSTVIEIIDSLCSNLFSSIDKNIFPLLDELVFIDKQILNTGDKMNKLLSTSPTKGILLLANTLFTAFVLYYVVRLIISQLTGANIESPPKFFMRAFLSGVCANFSIQICSFMISSINLISTFFCALGKNIFGTQISFVTLISMISDSSTSSFSVFSLDGILTGMLSISSFALIISFAFRYIVIKVLILLSPFAILCLSNSSTEGFFKSWFKSFASLLILQVVISVIMLIPYALINENSSTLFNKTLLVGSIIALLKSNQLIKEIIGGIGINTNFQSGIAGIKSMISR